jgi:hypothetical protein
MLVGYMRVSTSGGRHVLDLQRDALLGAGAEECHLFEDRNTGNRGDRGLQHRLTGFRHVVSSQLASAILLNTSSARISLPKCLQIPDRIIEAARSPIITQGAIVFPVVTLGMTEPSAIRRRPIP